MISPLRTSTTSQIYNQSASGPRDGMNQIERAQKVAGNDQEPGNFEALAQKAAELKARRAEAAHAREQVGTHLNRKA